MENEASAVSTPVRILKCSIFAGKEDWRIEDITLGTSGNIAVCGFNENTIQNFLRVYSAEESDLSDKPRILYEQTIFKNNPFLTPDDSEFDIKTVVAWEPPLCISFMKLNCSGTADEILVTGLKNRIMFHDYNQGVVVRSHSTDTLIQSMSVVENMIFIGIKRSNIVKIYNANFKEIKSIELKGIRDTPREIVATRDKLYVCVSGYRYGRAIVFSQDGGTVLTEYTTGQDHNKTLSVAVSMQLAVIAVLRSQNVIFFYPVSENKSFLTVVVDPGVSRIRMSDQGFVATGNKDTGEVKLYFLAHMYSYAHLKKNLNSQLEKVDCERLMGFMELPEDEINDVIGSDTPTESLLLALEEKGLIQPSDISKLLEAFLEVKATSSSYNVAAIYQKSRMQATVYGRFVATLSSHLTASLPADLCVYFNIPDERQHSIVSNKNPGLSLLLELDEMKIIKPSDVRALEQPFSELQLVQARAKLDEYHTQVTEEALQFELLAKESLDEKVKIFVQILQSKIKSWYETMTPVPWKKSCKWKFSDLFVSSSLILTDSKAKTDQRDVDPKCKLHYQDVLIHERVTSEKRLILEGEPGCGKTMLSSQLAYDWSQGKYKDLHILIFLPLKFVEGMRLVTAIRKFYMGHKVPAIDNDIEAILNKAELSTVLLLDGLEEYNSIVKGANGKPSEVHEIMSKAKYPGCTVVLTSRSDYAHDLPVCPMLKLGRFDEAERNEYIEKVFKDDKEMQQEIKRVIEDTPFILDLCSVPLLFVLTVHNIERMAKSQREELNRVTPFMDIMVEILSPPFYGKDKNTTLDLQYKSKGLSLEELAYNGLCKGFQQLSWPRDFMDANIENIKEWIDSGILVIEEGIAEVNNDERGKEGQLQEKPGEEQEVSIREGKHVPSSSVVLGEYSPRVGGQSSHVHSTRTRDHQKETKSDPDPLTLISDRFESLELLAYDNVSSTDAEWDDDLIEEDFALDWEPVTKKERKSSNENEEKHYRGKSRQSFEIPVTETDYLDQLAFNKNFKQWIEEEGTQWIDDESHESTKVSAKESCSFEEHWGQESIKNPQSILDKDEIHSERTSKQSISALTSKTVSLRIKFVHKVFQEWFAAKFLSCVIWSKDVETFKEHLSLIDPTDLHYVLRFTCHSCPSSCHIVLNHLQNSYGSSEGRLPNYLLDCMSLCYAEYDGNSGDDIKKVVRAMCKEAFKIQHTDSRLLQQSKVALLKFASHSGIPILNVQLLDVVSTVDDKLMTFDTGATMDVLDTLQVIEVSRWDQKLTEQDFTNLVNFIVNCKSVIKALLFFPNRPPKLQPETLAVIASKEIIVEWRIGTLVQTLDSSTGLWPTNLRTTKSLPQEDKQEKGESNTTIADLCTERVIDEEGGTIFLQDADVSLQIPAGALTNRRLIRLIVPMDLSSCLPGPQVLPRVTPLVICEPDDLHFKFPAKLTLPHCAVIRDPDNHKVNVKFGYRDNAAKEMVWESEIVDWSLGEHYCCIFLHHFTGVDVSMSSTEEKILRVIPYAKLRRNNKLMLNIWLCNDLSSDFQSVMQTEETNAGIPLESYDTFRLNYIPGPGKSKVVVSLEEMQPNSWRFGDDKDTIHPDRLSGSSKSKSSFLLQGIDGDNDQSYMYLILKVSQTVGEEVRDTTFVIRKMIFDLKTSVMFKKPCCQYENEDNHLFPKDKQTWTYTAVVYMDPIKDHKDDAILTLWLSPCDSTSQMYQLLQKEQELQYKHRVETENSFLVCVNKLAVISKIRFLNGRWTLSPSEKKIETDRIRCGSRAKFQFIGRRTEQVDTDYIDLQVEVFQEDEDENKITFSTDVEMTDLLYDIRRSRMQESTLSVAEESSDLTSEDRRIDREHVKLTLPPRYLRLHEESLTVPVEAQGEGFHLSVSKTVVSAGTAATQGIPEKHVVSGNQSLSNIGEQSKNLEERLRKCFMFLKRNLIEDWKDFGRYLMLPDSELSRVAKENSNDVGESTYQMLLSWKQTNGSNAIPEKLIEALQSLDRKDLAEQLAKL